MLLSGRWHMTYSLLNVFVEFPPYIQYKSRHGLCGQTDARKLCISLFFSLKERKEQTCLDVICFFI